MVFNEKLQELRKQKGITQEELAEVLFVSRTAISKWESGRGYPNIDSLKAVASFFSVTVDELLSTDRLLTIAEEDSRQKQNSFRDLLFGLLDVSTSMLFFLPFFAEKSDGFVREASLLSLAGISSYVKILYFVFVIAMVMFGIVTLALQNFQLPCWKKYNSFVSLIFGALAVLLFIVSSQPYAATLLFVFLIIKVIMLVIRR